MNYQTVTAIALGVAVLCALGAMHFFRVEPPEDYAPEEGDVDVSTMNALMVTVFSLAGFGLAHAVLGAFVKVV